MGRDDDEVWRAIVDNYGDRAELDAVDPVERSTDGEPQARAVDPDDADQARADRADREGDEPATDARTGERIVDPPEERFVPPDPPPLPRPPRDRALAWAGLFGSPAVILAFVVLGRQPPGLLSYALVAAFVGGFLYLVLRMDREPRDPWDDGAQL